MLRLSGSHPKLAAQRDFRLIRSKKHWLPPFFSLFHSPTIPSSLPLFIFKLFTCKQVQLNTCWFQLFHAVSYFFSHFNTHPPPGAGHCKHYPLLLVDVKLRHSCSALLMGESNTDCDAPSSSVFSPLQPRSEGEGPVASPLPGAPEPPEATKQTPQWENSPQERTSQCYQLKQQQQLSHSTSGATADTCANTCCQCKPG